MSDQEHPTRLSAAIMERNRHLEAMARAENKRTDGPSFAAKRATTSGALGVWELSVAVPVCEAYPTAEEAFTAQCDYMERLSARFPLPDGKVRAT